MSQTGQSISLEEIFVENLREYPEEHFTDLDSGAIIKIIGFAIGCFGPMVREAGIDILERYIVWQKKQPDNSIEDNGSENMIALQHIENLVQDIKQYTPDYERREKNWYTFSKKNKIPFTK